MCGLTGFARHPDAPNLYDAVTAFHDLMGAMPHRGRHATGLAVVSPTEPFMWKKAQSVTEVRKTQEWMGALDKINDDATIVMGHVRYATHDNAHEDAAAHPFHVGKVVGAHNGVITNWRHVLKGYGYDPADFRVDSEAAFAALDKSVDPAVALGKLKGYFALTWVKNAKLHLIRSDSAPLACAYIPEMRTLFWHSESVILERILSKLNVNMHSWEVKPGTLYRYIPQNFTDETTNVIRRVVALQASPKKVDTAQPAWMPAYRSPSFGGSWNGVTAREETPRTYSLKEIAEQMERLEGRVEALEAEKEHLYNVLNAHGLMDSAPETDGSQTAFPFESSAV